MINFHNREAKRVQETQTAAKSKPDSRQTEDGNTGAEPTPVNLPDVSSLQLRRTPLHVQYYPPPAPGLINDEHRSIYNAVWWRRFSPLGLPEQDKMDWTHKYRSHASELFWELARDDNTFLEIFLCFTAAKEVALKGSRDLRPYFRHKGRAISMVSQDVNREGVSWRVNAIAAISLLHRLSFAEQDYEAANLHMRALERLTAHRYRHLPSFCWLTIAWADLHLTAVQLRAPCLEYYIHPEYRERPYSGRFQFDTDTYFPKILPSELVVSPSFKAVATRLYGDLRECGYAYDQKDVFWKSPRGISYDIAYLLAETQVDIDKNGTLEEKLILIGFQMQFWGILNVFVPQRGVQSFHMSRLSRLLAPLHPSIICTRWLEHTANLDLLLWCLCNAAGSALHQAPNGTSSEPTPILPAWLQYHFTYISNLLGIVSPHDLETRLRSLPSSKAWNELACRSFFSRAQTYDDSSPTRTKSTSESHIGIFQDLRLIFDFPSSSPHLEAQQGTA